MFGLKQKMLKWRSKHQNVRSLPVALRRPLTLRQLQQENLSRTALYLYCDYYFDHFLPQPIRDHRFFFADGRGFGEDAFHAMWTLLFETFRPAHALEIGVYRGQTITLWKLLERHFQFDCSVSCISPFDCSGDAVSSYEQSIDFYQDVMDNHQRFQLPAPHCLKAYSNSPQATAFIQKTPWDLIYIDGCHDYEVAKSDWDVCSKAVRPGGLVVLDDASLHTDFQPPLLSTAGHPGPSKVAAEIDPKQFQEIFAVGHNRVFQKCL